MVDDLNGSSEMAARPDPPVDLLAAATPVEILRLATRSLVTVGADKATSHQSLPPSGLSLIGHDGFGPDLAQALAELPPGETPFGTAAATRKAVVVEDIAADPLFGHTEAGRVLLGAGCRACLSIPLLDDGGIALGVVTAHWERQVPVHATLVRQVAEEAAGRLTHAVRKPNGDAFTDPTAEVTHLRRALTTRTVIAQAQGMIMAREGIDAPAAFDVLRLASQRTNRKLYDIAAELVSRASDRKS